VLCALSIEPFEGGRWRRGGYEPMAGSDLTAMGIESFFVCSLFILLGLGNTLRHDVRSRRSVSRALVKETKRPEVTGPS
jgi:hypothetical protein